MKEEIKLAAEARQEIGSSAVQRLRKAGKVPGVIYGAGDPKNVSFDAATFASIQRHHHSENVMLSLDIDGDRTHKVLMREVQHHPLTGAPIHVDFYELSMTRKVRVEIPVELTGTPIGVTRDGGILEQLVREIEVECLPDDILEEIKVDVSALEVNDGLTVDDIALDPAKYKKITAGDIAVAAVSAARVGEEGEEAEEAATGAEPEVIGASKDDEDEDKDQE